MRISFTFFTLIFLLASTNLSAVCFAGAGYCPCDDSGSDKGCDFMMNSVKRVHNFSNWKALFYPKIHVRPSSGCYVLEDTNKIMSPGDCDYVCPQNVSAFRSKCDSSGEIKKEGHFDCVCAATVTSCSTPQSNNDLFRMKIGCFILPLGPPPRPFCNNCAIIVPNITIVPVKGASVIDPKIKVRVGTDVKRKCSNGDEVKISEFCINGSTTEILEYKEEILIPKETTVINYSGQDYKFQARRDSKNGICAKHITNNAELEKEQCYQLLESPDPIIKSYYGDKVSVMVNGYNNNQPFDIRYGQEDKKTGLYLVKPKVGGKRQFQYNADKTITNNPNSNVLCIAKKNPANDYSIIRNNRIVRFKHLESVFVPVKYDGFIQGFIRDYSPGKHNVNTKDTKQHILDTVILNPDHTVYIRPDMNDREKFKYETSLIRVGNETTPYVTLEGNHPILLSDQEKKDMRLTDPYMKGLCFPKPGYVDITDTTQDHYEVIDFVNNKCDFVTIEAWGAGAVSNKDNVPYNSGSSGGYTKGTIHFKKSDDKQTLKVKIGEGGAWATRDGGDTEVHLCRNNKTDCTTLLTAKGGKRDMVATEKGYVATGKLFDTEFLAGNPGIEGISKSNPEPLVPMPKKLPFPNVHDNGKAVKYPEEKNGYVNFSNTNCSSVQGTYLSADYTKIPGMGGCLSLIKHVNQRGGNGLVRVTCEQWEK
ncbi:MAG: hypothetical protein HRK26_00120 [Rickettsiaceae bacterium H1]|nr:hypothetical protein [Rickettsiaceae bacterium H1]